MSEGSLEVSAPAKRNWRQRKAENAKADKPMTPEVVAHAEDAVTAHEIAVAQAVIKANADTAARALERAKPNMRPGRTTIMLEENENIPRGGQFFGINGASFLLKPGIEVSVPNGIIDILNNAEMSVPVVNSEYLQVVGWRRKLRYPYRVIAS